MACAVRKVFCLLGLFACGFAVAQTVHERSNVNMPAHTLATPQFRTSVDLVLLNVSVLDRSHRAVSGLAADEFVISEDKVPQTLTYFSHEDSPVAIAVVLDASASMAGRFDDVRSAMEELLTTSNRADEFHVIAVGDTPRVALAPADSIDEFQNSLPFLQPDGGTALWDSMMVALAQLRGARFERKALVVVTDGGDNHSRTTEQELRATLKESDVQMYAVALYNPFAQRREERLGPAALDDLASVTGGRIISARDTAEARAAVREISRQIRDQYVLGYYPRRSAHDGRWHKVRVGVSAPLNSNGMRVSSRNAYFIPAD